MLYDVTTELYFRPSPLQAMKHKAFPPMYNPSPLKKHTVPSSYFKAQVVKEATLVDIQSCPL